MPSASDLVVALGPATEPNDILSALRLEDVKKRAQSFAVPPSDYLVPAEQLVNTVAASSDEEGSDGWGAWGEHPEVLNLAHRHQTHSTYSITMHQAHSLGSTRDGGISTDNSIQAGAVYLSTHPSAERQQVARHHLAGGQHSLASHISGGSSQPSTPTGSQQAEAAARIHEALSQLPSMTEEQHALATQLLTQLSSGSNAAQGPAATNQAPGFPTNLRIITPAAGRTVTWDAASPVASRFASHRPPESEPDTPSPGSPGAGYDMPQSPGPGFSLGKLGPLKSLRTRTTMPSPAFSPLKTVRSIRRVRSPHAQPSTARSAGGARQRSPFMPDSDDESDSGDFFQPVERSTKSLHISMLRGRPATVSPGADASPMKTMRSVRRVGEGLSSPRVSGQTPGSARKVRVRPVSAGGPGNSLRVASDLRLSHGAGLPAVASPMRPTRLGSMSVPAAGRSMSRFSMAAVGAAAGGVQMERLAMLRAEFGDISENESVEGSPPSSHYLQGAPSPGPNHRTNNTFLTQLYSSPAVLATQLSSQMTPMSPSARSLLAEFNKTDTPQQGLKSTRKAAPTPRTLKFDASYEDVGFGERTPSGSEGEGEDQGSILSEPQSPTASSPCPPRMRMALEAQAHGVFDGDAEGEMLMPSFSVGSETRSRPVVHAPLAQEGYDPATYAVLESRLSNIVKEHLERHLSGGSTHDADCFNGPLPAQSPVGYTTNHNTSRVRSPPTHTLSLDSMLTGQGLPQHLHHLHVAAPAVPSPVRVSAPARGSEDAEGGDWGSVHGSGGSTKFTPAARAAFEENAAQAREARSSLPGNACMLPVVGVEPPSLQVAREMSLKAATSGLQGQRALTSSSVSSLRITPFTALKPVRASVRARAAAVESPEDTDFSFSFSDAKKANEYSAAEVDAAIRFYQDGEGSGVNAWRGEDRTGLLSPARSPTRSLRAAFDTAAEDKTPVSPGAPAVQPTAAAPGSPPRTAQDLSAPLTNMFSSPGKALTVSASPTKQTTSHAATPAPAAVPPQANLTKSPGGPSGLRVEVPHAEQSCGYSLAQLHSMQIGSPDIHESSFAHVSSYGSNEVHNASDVSSNPPSLGGGLSTGSPAERRAPHAASRLAAHHGGASGLPLPGGMGVDGEHGHGEAPMSATAQAMLAQMNHMRSELAGLNRFLTTISATTSTLLTTLSVVSPGKPLATAASQASSSPSSPLAAAPTSPTGGAVAAAAVAAPASDAAAKPATWQTAFGDLLRTQQQQACILDQMQLQLAMLTQLQQLQALQDLERQMPGMLQQLRRSQPLDLASLAAGLGPGSPLMASPVTGLTSPFEADAGGPSLCARPSKGLAYQHLATACSGPDAGDESLLTKGLHVAQQHAKDSHVGIASGLTIQTAVHKAQPRQPLSINTSLTPSGGSSGFTNSLPLSPARPGLTTRPPVSPASAGFLSPVRDLRGPYGPGSQSPRTPSRPDSPSAMRPPQDFSLKQTMNMVTNSLFGDDSDDM